MIKNRKQKLKGHVVRFYLIAVMIRLERSLMMDPQIAGLVWVQLGQFDAQLLQMQSGNLFVQLLMKIIKLAR